MLGSQLVDLLQHFAQEELHELKLFVASPYFNRGAFAKETLLLLTFVEKTYLDLSEDNLNRTAAYRAVFPEGPFVEGKLDKVMSELHLMAKEIVAVHRYMQKDHEFHRMLDQLAFYRTRGLANRFENLKQKLLKQQEVAPYQNEAFFRRAFLLDHEIHNNENLHNQKRGDLHIPRTLQSLDVYYFFLKTELLNCYLLQQKFTQLDISLDMLRTIEESELPLRYAETYPVLFISHKIFRLFEQEHVSVEEFEAVRGLLMLHEVHIEPTLLRFYLTYLRNLCVRLCNNGQLELLPTLFNLQKDHLARGYLYYDYYDNKIPPSAFLSICNTAFKLKEYEWAKEFIAAHQNRIVGDNESRDYYRLLHANYLFVTSQYEEALHALPGVFQELDYHLYARNLELKIYYELDSELLPYKMDAFKMYLSRASQKVLTASKKERVGNFVNLLFQLFSVARGDKVRAERIIERIHQKQALAERDWLLEKAKQLI